MEFRTKLEATLCAAAPLFDVPGLFIVGSEVPNLLEVDAAATLVVSQNVDIGVPVDQIDAVRRRLPRIKGLRPSVEEPSVWLPERDGLLELNFVGRDAAIVDSSESYLLDVPEFPLIVFGPLSLLVPGEPVLVNGLAVPVPRIAGLLVEKMISERVAEKGMRDLLVVAGLLHLSGDSDLEEAVRLCRGLSPELLHTARSNLTILSLMDPLPDMPDPRPLRSRVNELLERIEMRGTGRS